MSRSCSALLLAVATLVALLPVPAAAAARSYTVSAGSLRVVVAADPWRMRFTDAAGREILNEHAGRGSGPVGALGFHTGDGWWRATKAVSVTQHGNRLTARLATTHPGRELTVTIAAGAEGVLDVRAAATGEVRGYGVSFGATDGERYLGFGQRANAVDQRGGVVENYVSDGPWQPEEHPFIAPFVPAVGLRERPDATYYPVPWLLSTRGYGVLVDNAETSYFRLGTDDPGAWSTEVVAAPDGETGAAAAPPPRELRMRVFGGPTPAGALARFTAATGRQPFPAAPWFLGPWVQPVGDARQQADQLRRLHDADAPTSVAQTYGHYLPGGVDRQAERQRAAGLHDLGVAVTTYFNPMVATGYEAVYGPAASSGAFTARPDGTPHVYRYNIDHTEVSQIDFATRAGAQTYGRLLDEAVADGFDGWMEDFGEYSPLDAARPHNAYPVDYHCAAHQHASQVTRPLARFVRSGWTGSARCSPIVWGGDPTTGWDFDGLTSAVRSGLSMGTSGVAIWGSDIGGFFALGPNALSPELLTRWVQFGAVSGVMRTQAEGVALPPKPRPEIFDPDQLDNWRRYAKLRTQLYPYLEAAAAEYRRTGMPLMRHLALAYPNDPLAVARDEEFLLGPDILAAPVLADGARTRTLYLPAGKWVDLWRSVSYDPRTGGLNLATAQTLAGGREVTLPAPIDQLPLLVRSGALLPLLPPEVDSLRGDGGPGVGLTERDGVRHLLAFPRGTSTAHMGTDGLLVSTERPNGWTLLVTSPHRRQYSLQASTHTLRQPFTPCRITLNGAALSRSAWSFDTAHGTLRVRFDAATGLLHAHGRCR